VAQAVAVQPASNEMLTQRIEMAAIYQLSDTAHWWQWWQRKSPGSESNSNKEATTGKNKYENGDNQPPVSCGTGGKQRREKSTVWATGNRLSFMAQRRQHCGKSCCSVASQRQQ